MAYSENNQSDEVSESSGSMDIRSIYYALIEKLWLIALCVVAAAFVTVGYLKKAPRIYSAQAILKVEQEGPQIFKFEEIVPEDKSQESLKTIEKMLTSRSLFERVVATNNLDKDPRFVPQVPGAPTPKIAQLAIMLSGLVKVVGQTGTRLVSITVEHSDPKLTAEIANSMVMEFGRQNFERQSLTYKVANEWLLAEEKRLKKKLDESEKALQQYRQKKNSISLDQSQDIVVQKLKALNNEVTEATSDLIKKQTEYERIQRLETNVTALLSMSSVANDNGVAPILSKISQQEAEFGIIKLRYKQKHPKYVSSANQITDLRRSLTNAVKTVVESIHNSFESSKATVEALKKELKGQEALAMDLSYQGIDYKVMVHEMESDQALHDSVVKRLKETEIKRDLSNNNVQLVQAAFVPEKPIKPEKTKVLMTGIMAGFLLGVGMAMGLYALDSTLKMPEAAEEFLKIPLLTTIPEIREVATGKIHVIMSENSECVESESFRTLRTTLAMLGPESERRSFLFTSAIPEEGKSFCAINFAVSLAQQGLRTLLIEGDLRCPAIAGVLLPKAKTSPGVTDYLSRQKKLDDIVQKTDVENFFFVPAGTSAPNPSELLSRDDFNQLIQEALTRYDRVVVDSAPVQPVSDTLLMVGRVKTVCLVVRANHTPKKLAMRATQVLAKARAPLVGFIFNGVTRNQSDSYYDYSYYYSKYTDKKEVAKV